ncbi:GerAB/ArcD/ProY family transporter [Bacillus cereus group sp. BfR-BA-01310]|uniref:GerAB/ArcD/ProY family transporter n=1 Tax=Bacillus cereus group sp. BfR-BA-01310 TaxID=2920287 RepID=UPI001F5A946A|nr:GerAB/ArcD/ProY family transporter [Bacillus cereus group sp. BfR-BA-01310]
MTNTQSKIALVQFTFFVIQCQIGVGILSLPNRLHPIAKGGGWISTLIAGLAIQLIILLMWFLLRRFPNADIYEIASMMFGNKFGKLLGFSYVFYFTLIGMTTVMLNACNVIKVWVLQATPWSAILILCTIACCYVAYNTFKVIVRFYVMASILIIPMALLIALGLTRADFSYIFPITEAGWWNIIQASKETITAMYGFEIILIAYPKVNGNPTARLKAISIANGFVTLFYTFTVWICFIVFSPKQIELIPEPVAYLLRSLHIGIIDRTDLIFIPIWMITVVASIASYYCAASIGIGHIFNLANHKKAVPIVGIITFSVALFIHTPEELKALSQFTDKSTYIFILILPFLFLIYSLLRNKKGAQYAQKNN